LNYSSVLLIFLCGDVGRCHSIARYVDPTSSLVNLSCVEANECISILKGIARHTNSRRELVVCFAIVPYYVVSTSTLGFTTNQGYSGLLPPSDTCCFDIRRCTSGSCHCTTPIPRRLHRGGGHASQFGASWPPQSMGGAFVGALVGGPVGGGSVEEPLHPWQLRRNLRLEALTSVPPRTRANKMQRPCFDRSIVD